jgi:hypothetical protein
MSLDCQSAAVAERPRAALTIQAIRPPRMRAPSRIHSQRRLVPELEVAAPGDADAEVAVGVGVGGVAVAVAVAVIVVVLVTVGIGVGVMVTVGVGVMVTVGVGVLVSVGVGVVVSAVVAVIDAALVVRLLIALEALLPQPAARHPAARMTAGSRSPFMERRMSVLPRDSRVSCWATGAWAQ